MSKLARSSTELNLTEIVREFYKYWTENGRKYEGTLIKPFVSDFYEWLLLREEGKL